ncbi:hypothetical protein CBM2585_A130439 [Cupriavidus taiwanensis]|nr:hypothetical protein CBM2585_A130439 [Cupriavidus taiwanensis]
MGRRRGAAAAVLVFRRGAGRRRARRPWPAARAAARQAARGLAGKGAPARLRRARCQPSRAGCRCDCQCTCGWPARAGLHRQRSGAGGAAAGLGPGRGDYGRGRPDCSVMPIVVRMLRIRRMRRELSRQCVSYREKSTLIKRNPCYPYRREDLRSFPAQLALSGLVRRPLHAAPWWCRLRKRQRWAPKSCLRSANRSSRVAEG